METTERTQPDAAEVAQPLPEASETAPEAGATHEPAAETAPEAGATEAGSGEADDAPEVADEPAEPSQPTRLMEADEVERLVADAYRKGRNESIAELMARPSMFESEPPASGRTAPSRSTPEPHDLLAHPRPSIWDL